MYCPECGNDAGDAKYCPECGADLAGLKSALKGKTTGQQGGRGGQGSKGGERQTAATPARPAGRGLSPAVIWGIFGAVAVVVIIVVVMLSGGFGGSSGNGASNGNASSTPVQGVTTGSYRELVQKGNELYDQGDAAFQAGNMDQGAAYFQAAAMTYAAAWQKQKTDPNLGTDFATALFYSGNIDAALKQIDSVIQKFPDFQTAHYNLGNYLVHKARIAEQEGDKKAAKADNAAAAKAYEKAVALDPASQVGQEAAARLKELPQ